MHVLARLSVRACVCLYVCVHVLCGRVCECVLVCMCANASRRRDLYGSRGTADSTMQEDTSYQLR